MEIYNDVCHEVQGPRFDPCLVGLSTLPFRKRKERGTKYINFSILDKMFKSVIKTFRVFLMELDIFFATKNPGYTGQGKVRAQTNT
jgi:hypothetical protein